jgi:hypothetical protein
MNSWLTHVNFCDNRRVIFCHPPSESAVLLTDLDGGWYTHLRTQTPEGWEVCHYLPTEQGIFFETISKGDVGGMGMIDPETYGVREYRTNYPVSPCGSDLTGKLWFGHAYRMKPKVESFIAYLPEVRSGKLNEFVVLTEAIPTYGRGQRSHLHPVLTPDRKSILFTGPDHTTQTNHLFLLDVSDLADVQTVLK